VSQSAHTPGPWAAAYLDNNGQPVVKAEHTEVATCWHHCVESLEVQAHANARLIAAAPELLDVVVRLSRITVVGEDHTTFASKYPAFADLVGSARAAIAKATGDA
jgi:hypothetical protein